MNCERIRKLLLTDYLDKEAGAKVKLQVEEHLRACVECRRFEQEVRQDAVLPFKNAVKPQAPDAVWANIRERISRRQSRRVSLLDLIAEKLKVFTLPKPAIVFASAVAVFLIVSGAIWKYKEDKNQVRDYFAEQIDFYAMLGNGAENNSNNGAQTLGTYIEKYFF